MNAKEARELTEKGILDSSNKTKMGIDAKIRSAVDNHKFCVYVDVPPVPESKVLRDHYCGLGYKWNHRVPDQRDGGKSNIEISW